VSDQFRQIIEHVENKYKELMNAPSFKCCDAPKDLRDKPGIYVFLENDVPLYVGRADDIRKRLLNHRYRSHNTATLAFLLARHATGILNASYKPTGSRAHLLHSNPMFLAAFDKARARIGNMDVRVVVEADPIRQALLEIYAAFVSGAKYNDFGNH